MFLPSLNSIMCLNKSRNKVSPRIHHLVSHQYPRHLTQVPPVVINRCQHQVMLHTRTTLLPGELPLLVQDMLGIQLAIFLQLGTTKVRAISSLTHTITRTKPRPVDIQDSKWLQQNCYKTIKCLYVLLNIWILIYKTCNVGSMSYVSLVNLNATMIDKTWLRPLTQKQKLAKDLSILN